MSCTVNCVIPATLTSSRFPRRALAAKTGKPLIQHVWEAATAFSGFDRVLVATPDDEIEAIVRGFGGEVCRTSPTHRNGTERCAETLGPYPATVVVNIQGDEPDVTPDDCACLLGLLEQTQRQVATICCPFTQATDCPHHVKVAIDRGRAAYFSRAPIPHSPATYYRHIGIYAYAAAALASYRTWPVSELEATERLEQLRWLANDVPIACVPVSPRPAGIDTPEQYDAWVMCAAGKAES